MPCMATVTAESPMSDPRLHLLHLSSPALPVGAYAYSQGLEYAEDAGWLAGDGLREWLEDCLQFGVARLDLPILARAMAACANGDTQTLERVGVGGPVGSGKTALLDALCKRLRDAIRSPSSPTTSTPARTRSS
jgi:hypothetical protein